MKILTEAQRLERRALQDILTRIRLAMDVYCLEFEDVIGSLDWLQRFAESKYKESELQPGSVTISDRCTSRMAILQCRDQELAEARLIVESLWDRIEAAAERLNPQIDLPLKEIHAETGTLFPHAPEIPCAAGS